ncbi:MAG: cyclic nucleotide-binding domain-containing protein [Verrucomicrobiota bacterium]|nr:cyclic nucleotide-binding domain-containing protein [Verrucomicrobiota bacterium]
MQTLSEDKIENETMETRVSFHPFFAGMQKTELALLTDCAMPVHFTKGEIVFREGEIANRFYVIETGKVVLESSSKYGAPVIVDTIGAGDLLGWSWMFSPYAWKFTARAVENTDALFFYGTILREYCERDPALGFELLKRMSVVMNRRLQAARNQMLSVHAKLSTLQPVVLESPFMDQELDRDTLFREGGD